MISLHASNAQSTRYCEDYDRGNLIFPEERRNRTRASVRLLLMRPPPLDHVEWLGLEPFTTHQYELGSNNSRCHHSDDTDRDRQLDVSSTAQSEVFNLS
ncbi:hypothetical protein EVAR_82683_1 [Eumeta japonica]|uniref:Uncharacterized protein n=1 Tax=Eumeta variegata TaxID=151549 RepID=A0A4C1V9W9_EUMVA|nr:hypothetical protein EVAR_82683_1 [Eumeta japonica]